MALANIDLEQIDEVKLKCSNVRVFLSVIDRDLTQVEQQPTCQQDEARLNRRSYLDLGEGELIVAVDHFYWIKNFKSGNTQDKNGSPSLKGLILNYIDVALHAVSRDTGNFPYKCIYMAIDNSYLEPLSLVQSGQASIFQVPGNHHNHDDNHDDDGNQSISSDLFFVPQDDSVLDAIFRNLSDCQTLHPDPACQGDSEDENNQDNISDEEENVRRRLAGDSFTFDENLYEPVD